MATNLYTQREIKRKRFGLRNERPQAPAGKALVLVGDNGMTVFQSGQKATHGEAVMGSYHSAFEVDTGMKDIVHSFASPARGGDVNFTVAVEAGYQVSDPAEIVRLQLNDPEPVLRRAIVDAVGQVTIGHDIENSEAALAAVRSALIEGNLAKSLPFKISNPSVRLDLDAQAKEFLRQKRQQQHTAILAEGSKEVTRATAGADQERMKAEMAAERERRRFEMEMERERAAMEATLAKERAEHELAIQQLRMDVYKPMIEGGLWPLLAQQLAQNPGDIGRVTEVILNVHNRKLETELAVLRAMIEEGVVEDRHVRNVVVSLTQSLEQSVRSGPLSQPHQLTDNTPAEAGQVAGDSGEDATPDDKQGQSKEE